MGNITETALLRKIERGKTVLSHMKELSKNAMESNEKLLLKILEENKDTEYGKKFGFGEIKNAKEYVEKVPLTIYDDYESYIDDMVKGKGNALSVREVVHFAQSSGSAGNPKKVPMCLEALEMFTDYTLNLCFGVMDKHLGQSWKKTRGVSLASIQFQTLENGTSYGAVSGKVREKYRDVEHYVYTSPLLATYPQGDIDTKYLHLRFALMEEDLSFMTCSFLNSAVDFIKYLERNWRILVDDISLGRIDENIKIPHDQREKLMENIVPMPERANRLKAEFEKGFDGIITRIWPDFKFIYGIGGGGFRVYAEKMRHYLGSAQLHLSIYSASEGIFATHIAPETDEMIMILDSAFCEFIDVEDESETPVTLDKVQVGHDYEFVLTNLSGFYRYRIKDVIRVTGFFGTCPTIKFLYRQNQMLSMAGEKTNDDCMNTTISKFCKKADFDLVEYSMYGDYDHSPGRYIVFIEGENFRNGKNLEEMQKLLEEELSQNNPSYGDKIKKGILAPLKLNFLRENTYAVYRQLMIAKGASVNQLKPVRMIDNPFREKYFFSMIEEI